MVASIPQDLGPIFLILQVTVFVALGVALVAGDGADDARPVRPRRRYCDALLIGAGLLTLCNIAIRLL